MIALDEWEDCSADKVLRMVESLQKQWGRRTIALTFARGGAKVHSDQLALHHFTIAWV